MEHFDHGAVRHGFGKGEAPILSGERDQRRRSRRRYRHYSHARQRDAIGVAYDPDYVRTTGQLHLLRGSGRRRPHHDQRQAESLPHHPSGLSYSVTPPSYRLSLRYKVEGSMPSTSAARVLLPPSLCSTHVMYARSITSRVGFACGRSATSGSARRSVSLSGSAARSIVVALLSTTARSRAFSSSRTLPGQSYARSATLASSASALGCSSRSLAIRLRNSSHRIWMSSRRSRSGGRWMAITFSR